MRLRRFFRLNRHYIFKDRRFANHGLFSLDPIGKFFWIWCGARFGIGLVFLGSSNDTSDCCTRNSGFLN